MCWRLEANKRQLNLFSPLPVQDCWVVFFGLALYRVVAFCYSSTIVNDDLSKSSLTNTRATSSFYWSNHHYFDWLGCIKDHTVDVQKTYKVRSILYMLLLHVPCDRCLNRGRGGTNWTAQLRPFCYQKRDRLTDYLLFLLGWCDQIARIKGLNQQTLCPRSGALTFCIIRIKETQKNQTTKSSSLKALKAEQSCAMNRLRSVVVELVTWERCDCELFIRKIRNAIMHV